MAGFTHFVRLILCAILTLGLTICEFVMCHFTHSISLFVVANQSLYNFLSLTSGVTAIAVRIFCFVYFLKYTLLYYSHPLANVIRIFFETSR